MEKKTAKEYAAMIDFMRENTNPRELDVNKYMALVDLYCTAVIRESAKK